MRKRSGQKISGENVSEKGFSVTPDMMIYP